MSLLILFSFLLLLVNLCTVVRIFHGRRQMRDLADISAEGRTRTPLVSIIVPACNEELTLEPALRSLVSQDYPKLEIIVIDDRSTDGTFGLLQRMRAEFPEIRVAQIRELPAGWLGKNHALYRGARQARGKILLFTDADVVMKPTTVSRAAACLLEEELDHLALIFRNTTVGGLLNAMVVDALGGLFFLLTPWKVRKPGSRAFIGVGAFNMIRSASYWQLGGHAALKMHPIDDIMLGKKVKQQGLSQDCLLGGDFVQVRWYATVTEMGRGLTKNIFAFYSYRLVYAAAGIAGIVIITIVPFWGALLTHGAARVFFILAVLCRLAVFSCNARAVRGEPGLLFWSLLTPYLIVCIVIRSVWMTLRNQGIDWRGTCYSLRELKEQEPLFTLFS